MKFIEQGYLLASGCIFFLVTLFHVLRLVCGWHVAVGTFEMPFWFSWLGFPASAGLSFLGFRLFRRTRQLLQAAAGSPVDRKVCQ